MIDKVDKGKIMRKILTRLKEKGYGRKGGKRKNNETDTTVKRWTGKDVVDQVDKRKNNEADTNKVEKRHQERKQHCAGFATIFLLCIERQHDYIIGRASQHAKILHFKR